MQQSLGIKIETDVKSDNHRNKDAENVNTSTSATFDQEKQKLLDAFVSLKAENQKLTFNLKEKDDECTKFDLEKNKLIEKVTAAEMNIKDLKLELARIKKIVHKMLKSMNKSYLNLSTKTNFYQLD